MYDNEYHQVLYQNSEFKVVMSHMTKSIFIISLKGGLDNRVSVYHNPEDGSIEITSESNFHPIQGGFEIRRD